MLKEALVVAQEEESAGMQVRPVCEKPEGGSGASGLAQGSGIREYAGLAVCKDMTHGARHWLT